MEYGVWSLIARIPCAYAAQEDAQRSHQEGQRRLAMMTSINIGQRPDQMNKITDQLRLLDFVAFDVSPVPACQMWFCQASLSATSAARPASCLSRLAAARAHCVALHYLSGHTFALYSA